MTEVVLIAAVARNGVIGSNNAMPWHLPADLRRFKALTREHPVVMGRHTFESIGRPLPHRTNIVLSRDPHFAPDDCEVHSDLEGALAAAEAAPGGDDAVFVIGGGVIYALVMPLATQLEITAVDIEVDGDTWFPDIDPDRWTCVTTERHDSDDDHALGFEFKTYLLAGSART